MIIVYGISNCDTVRKARKWLDKGQTPYEFHDFRRDGLDRDLLERLEAALGWQTLLNQRGTTWRKLPDSVRDSMNRTVALEAMLEYPALIKRPVVRINDDHLLVGFDADEWEQTLS